MEIWMSEEENVFFPQSFFLEWIGTILLMEASAPRDSKVWNTAGKMDSFFPFWLFQLSLGNPARVRVALTLSSWDCTRSTSTNPWLVHYYTALSTGIPRAAPKYLLVSCHIHVVHSWLAADEVCTFWLSGFELDQLSQSVLGFQGTAAQNLSQSLWSRAQLCPKKDNTPGPSQPIFLLLRNVSLVESCSAAGSPAPAKPFALAVLGAGQILSQGYAIWHQHWGLCAGQQLMPAIWIKPIQEQIIAIYTEICFS